MTQPNITNVFVLMLENRSFDHLLGFSGIEGTDAVTQQGTKIEGLKGDEPNSYRGQTYLVRPTASDTMPVDPGHEFLDVLEQLCGTNVAYPQGGPYPDIDSSGFVADYAVSPSHDEGNAPSNWGEIMKCFAPEQLPVLNALAKAFAVCDGWHASIPGPTWPNRLFACGASSAGLDHSPTTADMATWELAEGFEFPKGSIFDALRTKFGNDGWLIFAGHSPMAAALKGITVFQTLALDQFTAVVAKPNYPWRYTWIEPHYGDTALGTYRGGNSQHPMDGVSPGEALIKTVYEAIRNSPHWETSLLIVTWDDRTPLRPPGAELCGRCGAGCLHVSGHRRAGQRGVDAVGRHSAQASSPTYGPSSTRCPRRRQAGDGDRRASISDVPVVLTGLALASRAIVSRHRGRARRLRVLLVK